MHTASSPVTFSTIACSESPAFPPFHLAHLHIVISSDSRPTVWAGWIDVIPDEKRGGVKEFEEIFPRGVKARERTGVVKQDERYGNGNRSPEVGGEGAGEDMEEGEEEDMEEGEEEDVEEEEVVGEDEGESDGAEQEEERSETGGEEESRMDVD